MSSLALRLDEITGLGDAALTCWAAAECRHDACPERWTGLPS